MAAPPKLSYPSACRGDSKCKVQSANPLLSEGTTPCFGGSSTATSLDQHCWEHQARGACGSPTTHRVSLHQTCACMAAARRFACVYSALICIMDGNKYLLPVTVTQTDGSPSKICWPINTPKRSFRLVPAGCLVPSITAQDPKGCLRGCSSAASSLGLPCPLWGCPQALAGTWGGHHSSWHRFGAFSPPNFFAGQTDDKEDLVQPRERSHLAPHALGMQSLARPCCKMTFLMPCDPGMLPGDSKGTWGTSNFLGCMAGRTSA